MKQILKKYSNNILAEASGLPVGFISGYRKKIFTSSVMNGIERSILTGIKKYEKGFN